MKRNPGQWLREQLLERVFTSGMLIMAGSGCLLGGLLSAVDGSAWFSVLLGIGLSVSGAVRLTRRGGKTADHWHLNDIRKGARTEERIGTAIEYALTQPYCAVAHGVKEIAKVGDVDHLVVTPQRIWVVESKYTRLSKQQFPETLRRIAANVDAVSEWAPTRKLSDALSLAGPNRFLPAQATQRTGSASSASRTPNL